MVFGLSTNEGEAVARAKQRVKTCEHELREAQKDLDRTPRSENLKATQARDACRRALDSAKADLRTAEAELRRKS